MHLSSSVLAHRRTLLKQAKLHHISFLMCSVQPWLTWLFTLTRFGQPWSKTSQQLSLATSTKPSASYRSWNTWQTIATTNLSWWKTLSDKLTTIASTMLPEKKSSKASSSPGPRICPRSRQSKPLTPRRCYASDTAYWAHLKVGSGLPCRMKCSQIWLTIVHIWSKWSSKN